MDGCSLREGILLSRKRPRSVKKISVCFFERTAYTNSTDNSGFYCFLKAVLRDMVPPMMFCQEVWMKP